MKAVGRRLVRQGTCPGGVRQVTLLVIGLVLGLAAKLEVQVQSGVLGEYHLLSLHQVQSVFFSHRKYVFTHLKYM